MARPILDGVRIIDLTSGLAGPVATRLLAEAGADVLKIERPGGDPTREHHAPGFANWNRSKRSKVLDLGTPTGRSEFDGLLADADVLVHNFSPERARAKGLDDETMATRFPGLIVSAVTGYAGNHSDAERPGYEALVQARTGAMDEQLGHRAGPIHLRMPLASWTAAYLAAAGIMARLLVRIRTGKSGPAHTSLQQGMLAAMAAIWNREEYPSDFLKIKIPLPKGQAFPAVTLFECGDGKWIQTLGGFMENPLVIETIAEMGEPYVVVPFQQMPTAEEQDLWRRMFLRRPASEWLKAFWEGDVPADLVNELGNILRNPQVEVNGQVVEVTDPVWGKVRQAASPFRTEPECEVRCPAPTLGQHQDQAWVSDAGVESKAEVYPHRPLEGLNVLDFGMFLAGPFAPALMADMGANVIKVEAVTGDRMRVSELMFIGCQRGKRSIAIDLSKPESRQVLEKLVQWADVVHHNLRAPAARTLGIDEPTLRKINPDLVYCHVSSYGAKGPRADWPGYDPIAQATSGFMMEGAGEGNPPMWTRVAPMDFQTALASLVATLLAVYEREKTGKGSLVTTSLLGAAATINSETMILADGTFAPTPSLDHEQRLIEPGYGIYQTQDGWVAVAAVGVEKKEALRKIMEVDDDSLLEGAFAVSRQLETTERLNSAGVPAEVVRLDYEAAFFDDQANQEARLAVHTQHKQYGRLDQLGAYWSFGDLDLRLNQPPPLLGEHTIDILEELGFGRATIEMLLNNGSAAKYDTAVYVAP
ncbi:CoA transferase [Rhodococcus artemisiae]|uniref:CoA transferase n=1 Tax=Rhodococcus artemisiae TaxID=714159 RepID=A0ABU7LEX2_9NOCA|nr:CoA transferase [Rhodococcus artemisiae]MEE2060091.1 CoA transferase [Rhodococcus artemisiae]